MQLFWITLRRSLIGISSDRSVPEREENVPYKGPSEHTNNKPFLICFSKGSNKNYSENIFFP